MGEDGKLDWRQLNALQKAWPKRSLGAVMDALRRRNEEAILAWHVSDLAAQWRADATIAADLIDAGGDPPQGRRC
jgi:hypothetical protein